MTQHDAIVKKLEGLETKTELFDKSLTITTCDIKGLDRDVRRLIHTMGGNLETLAAAGADAADAGADSQAPRNPASGASSAAMSDVSTNEWEKAEAAKPLEPP